MTIKSEELDRLRAGIDTLVRVLKITDAAELPDGTTKLNPTDSQTLVYITQNEGCISTDISKLLNVSPTTTSAIVDRLVKRELVLRERTETNRRVVLLSPTQQGKSAAEAILDEQRLHCAQMLGALDPEVRSDFINHVTTIASKISTE